MIIRCARIAAIWSTDEAESGVAQEHVVFEGGPVEVARNWLRRSGSGDVGQVVKVPHRGGYEHYHATGGQIRQNGQLIPVYRWTQRTQVAE
jgi:hypothetical protein